MGPPEEALSVTCRPPSAQAGQRAGAGQAFPGLTADLPTDQGHPGEPLQGVHLDGIEAAGKTRPHQGRFGQILHHKKDRQDHQGTEDPDLQPSLEEGGWIHRQAPETPTQGRIAPVKGEEEFRKRYKKRAETASDLCPHKR